MTFQPGNKHGGSHSKPFRDALRLQIAEAGDNQKRLRKIAEKLLRAAEKGEPWAVKEIADRLDSKSAQAIVGDSDYDPLRVNGRVEAINEQMAHAIYGIIHKAKLEAEERRESSEAAKLLESVTADTGGDPTE
jgi:hypothetical protein